MTDAVERREVISDESSVRCCIDVSVCPAVLTEYENSGDVVTFVWAGEKTASAYIIF